MGADSPSSSPSSPLRPPSSPPFPPNPHAALLARASGDADSGKEDGMRGKPEPTPPPPDHPVLYPPGSESLAADHELAAMGQPSPSHDSLPRYDPGSLRSHRSTDSLEVPALMRTESGSPFGTGLRGRPAAEKRQLYWRNAAINVSLILSWYLFSTLISVYNKWMFSPKHYNFSYPLFVSSMHMTLQFALSGLLLISCWGEQIVPRDPATGKRLRPTLSDWALKVAPCALATALDIGLSNLSLKTITLTFYTMCKSSNLAFVLFFAFLFRLEVISWRLIGIIAIITSGVIMMVAAETQFVLIGAVEVLTASGMGGLRWSLTQILLDKRGLGLSHPVGTIFWLSPIMAIGLVIASLSIESWHDIFVTGGRFASAAQAVRMTFMIMLPGCLAFAMNMSEYTLIQRTSVVTLSVAGIFKEVLTVIVASTLFGDELTPINVTGLCITLVGIGLYNWLRYRVVMGLTSPSGGRLRGSAIWGGTRRPRRAPDRDGDPELGASMSMRHRPGYTHVPSYAEDAPDTEDEQHEQRADVTSGSATFPVKGYQEETSLAGNSAGEEIFDAQREVQALLPPSAKAPPAPPSSP